MKLGSRLTRFRVRRTLVDANARLAAEAERKEFGPHKLVRKDRVLLPATQDRAQFVPDLLHARASISVDEPALRHALSFAFVAGSASGALGSSLARMALASSHFTPESLEDGLFVDELIARCFAFSIHGKAAPLDRAHLHRLITEPPTERADVEFRQAILAELVSRPKLVRGLEAAYAGIARLAGLLDEEGSDARLDMTQWRLDVLTAIRDALATFDATFEGTSSGLLRLHRFGAHVRATPAYARLDALLAFEGDAARANLQVRLGADGRIRALDILSLDERRDSHFYVGPVQRLLRRLKAWLQGYRIGPGEVVERWLEAVFDGVRDHVPTLFQLKGDLEFFLAAMHFKGLAESKGLAVSLPKLVQGSALQSPKVLRGLFNPLLLTEPTAPVPTDLTLPGFHGTCITTGPNSGGKTRLLQALALCQLLGECGAFVPARDALLKRASGMFVSLGERSHADQKEGRLGMELMRIRRLFERARPGSLVVLDELCSGTNPSEGEEIIRMLLELLHELGHEVHVTTHFLKFAETLQSEPAALGLQFLQVELDAEQRPTYRFVPGVATTSLAHQTAQRLGVTREQLRGLVHKA